MIFITSSELNGTNYDRRVNNFTFPYLKEIISPKKDVGCWPLISPNHSSHKVHKPWWISFHFISNINVLILYEGGKSVLPYPFQVSESFLLPFPDTVDYLQAHAVYPTTLCKVSAQFTAHVHNLLPVATVSLVHGLCRAAGVLFSTPQASH